MTIKEKLTRQIINTIRNAPVISFNAEEGVDEEVVANQDWLLGHIDKALAAGIPPDRVVITIEGRDPKPNELRVGDPNELEAVLNCYRLFGIKVDSEKATKHEVDHNLGIGFRTAFHWVEREGQERSQLSVSPDFRGEIALPDLLDSIGGPKNPSPVDERMHRKIIDLLKTYGFKHSR